VSDAVKRTTNGEYKDVIRDCTTDRNIDLSVAQDLRKKYAGKFVIGHVARLHDRYKGQSDLIEVAKKLYEDGYKNFHFLFIGKGPDLKKLQRQADGYDSIEFIGFKENIEDYYGLLDLFVFPSRAEGLGSSILDAFKFKVPVVATDAGGIPELVKHEETGLLCEAGNEDQLRANIVRAYSDLILCKIITEKAYIFVQKFNALRQAEQYYQIYTDVLAERK
jgi:glycosyltransferase involved in cell wall biosynthesis